MLTQTVYAQCPICIVTVGGGLILAKKLGIDDLLVSIWISGLNTAVAIFFASKIKNKTANNPFLWTALFFLITLFYLYFTRQIGNPRNRFFGIDKVLLGLIIGVIIFLVSFLIDRRIRNSNNGKVLFHYQKVIIPVTLLVFSTVLFKLIFGL